MTTEKVHSNNMTDNRRLGNKVRLLHQLLDTNNEEQVHLLTSLLRTLEDKSQGAWCNMDARRMIIAFLSVHHPYVNTAADQERWENDRCEENTRRRQNTEPMALEKTSNERYNT